jgi:enoyl-CoA hydratase
MILEREQHGRVQVLTLNRPEAANSLNPELLGALGTAFREIAEDDDTQVVVLTGAGERIFCGGMDLRAFSESRDRPAGETDRSAGQESGNNGTDGGASYNMRDMSPKPVIAAVNGAAVGGGFELVLSCDLAVAVETARFGLPEVKRGLLAGGGGTLLGTRIPLPLALEVALTGELIDAAKAASWGLLNRVVPADELLDTALALAASIAANGPLAIRTTKTLVRRAVLDDPKRGWGTPEEMAVVFGSEDAKEGAMAFLEKRAPNWKGR